MDKSFKDTALYGGAMTANIPAGFEDVSNIRQVPDHQEVFLSASGFSSLIFDLGERVTEVSTDEDAIKYHLQDIVDEADSKQIWSIEKASMEVPLLPPYTPTLTAYVTTRPPAYDPSRPRRPNTPISVAVITTLIRLEPQSTDMMVTINIPRMLDDTDSDEGTGPEAGRHGRTISEGQRLMEEICRTLHIKDWGLFGGDEA